MSVGGWLIVALLVGLLALELVGVARPAKGDTITEVYRTVRDKLPKPLAYVWMWLIVGLLVWTVGHFMLGWL